MAGDDVPISVAAGAGDDGADFGTDATAILEAITGGPPGAETLVLVDVGSAVMSAELALDFLPDDDRARVRLCPAPFVEGTLSAAVQAGLEASLDTVYQEAVGALQQKQTSVADATGDAAAPASTKVDSTEADSTEGHSTAAHTIEATLPNPHGLHARPAARFVRTAASFDAEIVVENQTAQRGPVAATSLSSVAMLGAVKGDRLRLSADGPDANDALETLAAMIRDGFGEIEAAAEASGADPARDAARDASESAMALRSLPDDGPAHVVGDPVASGIAIGPAYQYQTALPEMPTAPPADPRAAWKDFDAALQTVAAAMQEERDDYRAAGADDAAGILDAQSLLLSDDALRAQVRTSVLEEGRPVARAWMDAITSVAEDYAALDDPYLQQRADDVRDVGRRVVRHLVGATASIRDPGEPFVLVADTLVPSDVTAFDDLPVRGVVCARGNPTSHSAILLRSQGCPAVFGAGLGLLAVDDGTPVALRGDTGAVWVDPEPATAEAVRRQHEAQEKERGARIEAAQAPAKTSDGIPIHVAANVNRPADAHTAARMGADGVGLLRTEFLFTGREAPPSEDEQVDALGEAVRALNGAPVVIRALDVGGDKPLPYVPLPEEANPFLGLRGIRVLLQMPDLFKTQLRAILRVAADHPVRLLLPMVAMPSEVEQARARIQDARNELRTAGHRAAETLPLGMMIETPASALGAARYAEVVDFFSIGTNDLTQYTMAADREHGRLGGLSDAFHPPVLSLIARVAAAARDAETPLPVSVCGELASHPPAVPLLLGLGVQRLSVAPPSIPTVKALVRVCDSEAVRALADDALTAADAAAVREQCRAFLNQHVSASEA